MEQPLPQCWSTNSVLRAFFPRVAIGRLSLKIDRRNLPPRWRTEESLSVATWDDSAWIGGTASSIEYISLWIQVKTQKLYIVAVWSRTISDHLFTRTPMTNLSSLLSSRNDMVTSSLVECLSSNVYSSYPSQPVASCQLVLKPTLPIHQPWPDPNFSINTSTQDV